MIVWRSLILAGLLSILVAPSPAAGGPVGTVPAGSTASQAARPPAPGHSALISVPEKVFDAGEVESGATVSHDFPVQNQGTGPEEIQSVKPG
ncbi:MAG: DUF1573 domain-containing protein [Proteobacteria bacterium]|nr:DUF1573 domain-containing protein [Pseudomonadota bacterium]